MRWRIRGSEDQNSGQGCLDEKGSMYENGWSGMDWDVLGWIGVDWDGLRWIGMELEWDGMEARSRLELRKTSRTAAGQVVQAVSWARAE
jgi:hypothetical protein